MVELEPVTGQDGEITGRGVERDRDPRAAKDPDATVPARSLVERERREVVVAPDLVLELHVVGEVAPRRDRAVCAVHAVLPRAPPLLNPLPAMYEPSDNVKKRYTFTQSKTEINICRGHTECAVVSISSKNETNAVEIQYGWFIANIKNFPS